MNTEPGISCPKNTIDWDNISKKLQSIGIRHVDVPTFLMGKRSTNSPDTLRELSGIMQIFLEENLINQEQMRVFTESITGFAILKDFFTKKNPNIDLNKISGNEWNTPIYKFLWHDYLSHTTSDIREILRVIPYMNTLNDEKNEKTVNLILNIMNRLIINLKAVIIKYGEVMLYEGGESEYKKLHELESIFPRNSIMLSTGEQILSKINNELTHWAGGRQFNPQDFVIRAGGLEGVPYNPIFLRIIDELMRNSIKAFFAKNNNPENKESLQLNIALLIQVKENVIHFSVGDNGPGLQWKEILRTSFRLYEEGSIILPHKITRIFDQVQSSIPIIPKELTIADIQSMIFNGGISTNGTLGYGLNAVEQLLRANGGSIEVHEGIYGGIVFTGTFNHK